MASVSVAHLILFIASLTVAAGVAGTMTNSVGQLGSAISDQSLDVSGEIRTDAEVISDGGSTVYNRSGNENVTLLVKNTGSKNLPPDLTGVEVLVDGQYITAVNMTVLDGPSDSWQTGSVVRLEIDAGTLSAGDHRVRLAVHGAEETFRFRVS